MKIGDNVKMWDWNKSNSIPAYRDMVGTVIEVNPNGSIKVRWHCGGQDVFPRKADTVVLVQDEPALNAEDICDHPECDGGTRGTFIERPTEPTDCVRCEKHKI